MLNNILDDIWMVLRLDVVGRRFIVASLPKFVVSNFRPLGVTGFGLSREILHDAGLRANGRKDDSVSAPQGKRR